MNGRRVGVTVLAGVFYLVMIVGNGAVAVWYSWSHQMPVVAWGVGLLAVVAFIPTVRILKRKLAARRNR